MTIYEITALIVAMAFAVLIACLIPILVQFRKMLGESAQLLAKTKEDLPELVSEMRGMSQSVNDLADQLKEGVEHANGFFHAIGNVGDTVQQVNDAVRGKGGMLLVNAAGLFAGIRAASAVIKRNSDG